jgi:hypothetical protein
MGEGDKIQNFILHYLLSTIHFQLANVPDLVIDRLNNVNK